jgi:hypothetical protein
MAGDGVAEAICVAEGAADGATEGDADGCGCPEPAALPGGFCFIALPLAPGACTVVWLHPAPIAAIATTSRTERSVGMRPYILGPEFHSARAYGASSWTVFVFVSVK